MANTFEYFAGLRKFNVYSNTVNWKPHIGQKISFKRKHNSITINSLSLVKPFLKDESRQLLLGIFQESFLDTPGMPYKKGQNFKLPFMIQKLSHRL